MTTNRAFLCTYDPSGLLLLIIKLHLWALQTTWLVGDSGKGFVYSKFFNLRRISSELICTSRLVHSETREWNMFHSLTLLYWACELNIVLLLSGLNNWTFYGSLHLYNKLSAPINVYNTPVPVRNGNNIDAFHGQSHFSMHKTQSNNAAVNKSNNSKFLLQMDLL